MAAALVGRAIVTPEPGNERAECIVIVSEVAGECVGEIGERSESRKFLEFRRKLEWSTLFRLPNSTTGAADSAEIGLPQIGALGAYASFRHR